MSRFKKSAIVAATLYVAVVGILFFMQEKLIFLPSKLPPEYTYSFELPFEEWIVETEDGARLNALHFKTEQPKGLVLYYHGNAGDLSRWGEVASYFTQFDYDVLVMDYRTYGKSTGTLSEKALYKDAEVFYQKATELFPEEQITVYGRSLGTAFATYVASKNNPHQLILESPFYSLEYVATKRYWFLPVRLLLKYQFPSHQYIENVVAPITIFHGTEDGVVPYQNSVKLYELLQEDYHKHIRIDGGGHNDLINFGDYRETIQELLS